MRTGFITVTSQTTNGGIKQSKTFFYLASQSFFWETLCDFNQLTQFSASSRIIWEGGEYGRSLNNGSLD